MRRKLHWVRVSSGHLCEAEAPTESETRQALRTAIFAQGNALISVSLNNKITFSGDAL